MRPKPGMWGPWRSVRLILHFESLWRLQPEAADGGRIVKLRGVYGGVKGVFVIRHEAAPEKRKNFSVFSLVSLRPTSLHFTRETLSCVNCQ